MEIDAMAGLKVEIVREEGADPSIGLPEYATPGAAGADVRANLPPDLRASGLIIEPMQRSVVPTGLRLAIPVGFEVQLRPRSGLALKHGITLINTPGTIDSDYRGPLGVLVVNLGSEPFTLGHGERIAQMIVAPVLRARFDLVDELDETKRGAGGFGSTGRG